ncbi:MAG: hypothetical protein RIM80_24450, partial [Alphaproteobacteria bacterium]
MAQRLGTTLKSVAAAAGLALAMAAAPANAALIQWTVQNAFFEDGTALTGTFVVDSNLGIFSDINLQTETGTLGGASYLGDPVLQTQGVFFDTASGFSGIGEQGLALVFADFLLDPSQVVDILFGLEGICTDPDCADPPDPSRALLSGASVAAAAVPAPLGLPLALTGAAVFGLVARRRRR